MDAENELLTLLIDATGLPKEEITKELNSLLIGEGLDASQVSLEQLREAMANYLQDVLLEVKDQILGSIDSNS